LLHLVLPRQELLVAPRLLLGGLVALAHHARHLFGSLGTVRLAPPLVLEVRLGVGFRFRA